MNELSDWIWCHIPQAGKIPSRRQLQSSVMVGHKWFIFGGFSDDKYLNDVWVLNFGLFVNYASDVSSEKRKWKMRGPKKHIHDDENWPSARNSHSMCVTPTNSVIIFGGISNGNPTNDTYEISLKNKKSKKLQTMGDIPSPRGRHQAVIHDNKMYIFGGFSGSLSNDLFYLDLTTLQWKRIQTKEPSPCPREFHTMNILNNKLIVFGGGVKEGELNDLWSFDFVTESWTSIELLLQPTPRKGHQAVIFQNWLVVHGGKQGNRITNEILIMDIDSKHVQFLRFSDVDPTPRYLHSLCIYHRSLYVFGGLVVSKLSNDKFRIVEDAQVDMFSKKERAIVESRSFNGIFARLPTEIVHHLLGFCSPHSLVKMLLTNKYFRTVCSADHLWKPHVIRHVNNTVHDTRRQDAIQNMEAKFLRKSIANSLHDSKSQFWKFQYSLFFVKNAHWKMPRDPAVMKAAITCFFESSNGAQELKMGVFGQDGSGKSCLVCKYVIGHFVEDYGIDVLKHTTNSSDHGMDDSFRKQVSVHNHVVLLDILDTWDVQNQFEALVDQWIRMIPIFIIVYSITDRKSFEEVEQWFQRIERIKDGAPYVAVLVGNKSDLAEQRQVAPEEGIATALRWHCSFFETSCKNHVNIEETFLQAIDDWIMESFRGQKPKKKEQCSVM